MAPTEERITVTAEGGSFLDPPPPHLSVGELMIYEHGRLIVEEVLGLHDLSLERRTALAASMKPFYQLLIFKE